MFVVVGLPVSYGQQIPVSMNMPSLFWIQSFLDPAQVLDSLVAKSFAC